MKPGGPGFALLTLDDWPSLLTSRSSAPAVCVLMVCPGGHPGSLAAQSAAAPLLTASLAAALLLRGWQQCPLRPLRLQQREPPSLVPVTHGLSVLFVFGRRSFWSPSPSPLAFPSVFRPPLLRPFLPLPSSFGFTSSFSSYSSWRVRAGDLTAFLHLRVSAALPQVLLSLIPQVWQVVFPFSCVSEYFLISFVISSVLLAI